MSQAGAVSTSFKYKHLRSKIVRIIIWLSLVGIACLLMYPFLWMISTSLRTMEEVYTSGLSLVVENPKPQNFIKALTTFPFFLYLGNTLLTAIIPMIMTCLSSSLVGYGFAKIPARGSKLMFMIMLSTMMLPGHVTMIPNFIIFKNLDWINSLYPLICTSIFSGGFNVFLMRQFYLRMTESLDEAARIDGCTTFQIWSKIYIPLSKPVLVTVALFEFMGRWSDFMGPLIYVNSDRYKTLQLGLRSFITDYTTETNLLMAASLVIILPCIIIFFFFQKYFIKGITFTGEK